MNCVNFHCKNCNSATPEKYKAQTILNITCIEELKKIISFNLLTCVKYNSNCKNCAEIKNEFMDINNYEIINYYYYLGSLNIFNIKLIEKYGLFIIGPNGHYLKVKKNNNDFTYIDEKEFFDLIKIGSLLEISWRAPRIIDKIKEKLYEVNLVQILYDNIYFYLIESPTLTKPARKNNSRK